MFLLLMKIKNTLKVLIFPRISISVNNI